MPSKAYRLHIALLIGRSVTMMNQLLRTAAAGACMLAIMLASDVAGIAKAQRRVIVLRGAEARAHMEKLRAAHAGMGTAHENAVARYRRKALGPPISISSEL